jgi:hypothetical protein
MDVVIAVGASPQRTLNQFTSAIGHPPLVVNWRRRANHVTCWFPRDACVPFAMEVVHGRAERMRHHRKYELGELGYRKFYFRDPDKRLNMKAQNLAMFCQIAEGVDDAIRLFISPMATIRAGSR